MDSFCDRVGFQEIVAAYERDTADNAALTRTVWPCKDRKYRHAMQQVRPALEALRNSDRWIRY